MASNGQGTRREIFAWATYDWANSAWSTLLITFIFGYVSGLPLGVKSPEALYGYVLGFATIPAALLSPIVGALADARANKHLWFRGAALAGAACAAGIGLAPADAPWLAIACTWGGAFFFELSFGLYNSFLPDLADDRTMNRVSAIGFAMGYVGGGIALALALALYQYGDRIGLTEPTERVRAALVMLGAWWSLFSLPALITLRDRRTPMNSGLSIGAATARALAEVRTTISHVRSYGVLATFLVAYLLYNEGVQTVMSQASVVAKVSLGMEQDELAKLVLAIQFASLPGAFLIGWLADKAGVKATLLGCLLVWIGLLAAAWTIETRGQFWILGMCVAVVMGGTQSVSRSTMGAFTPPARSAEFFGFFNLSSRATSFGTILFAFTLARTDNPKAAIFSLLGLIVAGLIVLLFVNVAKGREQARQS